MQPASIRALILVAAVVGLGLALNHRRLPTWIPDLENVENDAPISQDTARIEKRRREWLEWNRRTLSDAYDNWWAGITLLCADAHTRYSNLLGSRKADYLASPEVWSDITSVYDEYLNHHPEDHVAWSKYASLAYDSLHYQKAHALFQKIGNNLTSWTEFPYYPLEAPKSFRDYSAKVAAKPKAAQP